jgi:hypothetical protein
MKDARAGSAAEEAVSADAPLPEAASATILIS